MKYEIDIKGLPEGYKALEVRFDPSLYNKYPGDDGYTYFEAKVKVKKKSSRAG